MKNFILPRKGTTNEVNCVYLTRSGTRKYKSVLWPHAHVQYYSNKTIQKPKCILDYYIHNHWHICFIVRWLRLMPRSFPQKYWITVGHNYFYFVVVHILQRIVTHFVPTTFVSWCTHLLFISFRCSVYYFPWKYKSY